MKKCTVVINPRSGKGLNDQLADKISSVLSKYNYEPNVIITEYRGHAEDIVKTAECDLLISVGGDGTYYEVMNGNFLRKEQLVLSHIPVGTTNDIGHMYGLTKDIITNLKSILDGKVKEIDICSINNRDFVYVASFGKFMEIPYETPQELKNRLGHLAYLLNGAKEVFKKPKRYNVTYEIDGVKHNGKYTFIIISNANRIAGINGFYNDVLLDDGKFEVMFCSINHVAELANAFLMLKTGNVSHVSGIEMYKTDNLTMTFNDDVKPWCLDGEKYDCGDQKVFEIASRHKVKMLIPTKNISKLFTEEKKEEEEREKKEGKTRILERIIRR